MKTEKRREEKQIDYKSLNWIDWIGIELELDHHQHQANQYTNWSTWNDKQAKQNTRNDDKSLISRKRIMNYNLFIVCWTWLVLFIIYLFLILIMFLHIFFECLTNTSSFEVNTQSGAEHKNHLSCQNKWYNSILRGI